MIDQIQSMYLCVMRIIHPIIDFFLLFGRNCVVGA